MKQKQQTAPDLAALASEGRAWLLDKAAPLWATRGRHSNGLLAERLSMQASADNEAPKRLFVQARHVFSFCEIGRLGWGGPWLEIVNGTVDHLLRVGRRNDGLFVHSFDKLGHVKDPSAKLYDQAFMLLGLCYAARATGREELIEAAERLTDVLEQNWRHPSGGFLEAEQAPIFRSQNPHMHLLEAFQALDATTTNPRWRLLSEEISQLCIGRFIHQPTGAVREYFTNDLLPLDGTRGSIVEPGHCFEWAWLFERMERTGGGGEQISDRLSAFAREKGIDFLRGVAVNEVLLNGEIHDSSARLWPQTERLKLAVARWVRTSNRKEADEVRQAYDGLALYFNVPIAGTWYDKFRHDGSWVAENAPGSSLYHIACAMAQLVDATEGNRA